MIGRAFDRRAASLKPALVNAANVPVQANAAGMLLVYGTTG
jgi:hypothetical protein